MGDSENFRKFAVGKSIKVYERKDCVILLAALAVAYFVVDNDFRGGIERQVDARVERDQCHPVCV